MLNTKIKQESPLGLSGDSCFLFQKLCFYDTQFASGLFAVFGFEEVEFTSGGLSHLDNTPEGILVLAGTF